MASKYGTTDEEDQARSYVSPALNAALTPVRLVLSKPARRAYLTTLLFTLSAIVLFGFAITAYVLFYWSYIPPIGFEKQLHLQFDDVSAFPVNQQSQTPALNLHPYAVVTLAPDIASAQPYDVHVELSLPRTRGNRNAGNFMLEATMYAPGSILDAVKEGLSPGTAPEDNKLAVSRRSALLKYRSIVVEYLWKLTELHWYLLNFRDETEKLTVSMFEGVEFAKGWRNVPATMRLEIQSTHRMQIYSAKAIFRARFRGLRWIMYNHRIISALVFITGFWVTEVIFAGLAWAALSYYLSPATTDTALKKEPAKSPRIKDEEDEDDQPVLSDTERTFPTLSKQPPLRYESPSIKREEDDDAVILPQALSRATEADDEDEDMDVFQDSGLGTSLESSGGRRDSVRRRRSKLGSGDG